MLKGDLEHSWRWRESNPRPSVHHQGFSGRSLLCISQPRRSRKQAADGLSRCQVSRLVPRPGQAVILLADARHRVEGIPGLTDLNSPQATSSRSVRDIVLALIGLRPQDLRGHNRNPRPASPGSTTEVETVHPLLSCAASTVRSAVLDRTRTTRVRQPGFPGRRARAQQGAGPARWALQSRQAITSRTRSSANQWLALTTDSSG